MLLNLKRLDTILEDFSTFNIIPPSTMKQLAALASESFVFKEQLDLADSIHLHIKVPATASLPHESFLSYGAVPQNEKEGYIKYAFPGGVNLIYSSIPVSQEERAGLATFTFPHLDHIGIDIRKNSDDAYAFFNKIPDLSEKNNLPFKRQGGDGKDVYCCHVAVNEKYWVYPKGSAHLEFAFGPLVVSDDIFGCDLRPADPSLGIADEVTACCGTSNTTTKANIHSSEKPASRSYYQPEDLSKFSSIAQFQPELAESFFAYYGDVFKDNALTAREKSLIALAVSHAVQCPYCIDAYSTETLARGYSKQQMMEAVHVAAAIKSGATLVHSVQMMNRVKEI